jgi:hypothetical protein
MTTPIVPTPTQHENDELVTQQFEGTLPSAPWHHAMDGSAIDPQSPDPTPKTTSWPEGGSGDGSAPTWVPANAKIHIDFLGGTPQGRAWSGGAQVAIDTLLGSDPNTVNGWGTTGYDPALLTSDGFPGTSIDGSPAPYDLAFIGAALAGILTGATMVVRMKFGTSPSLITASSPLVILSADGMHGVEWNCGEDNYFTQSYDGPASVEMTPGVTTGSGALNALAMTYAVNRSDIALNGREALTTELTEPEVVGLVAALCSPEGCYAQSITIYDPLPDTTGLSELSAVG